METPPLVSVLLPVYNAEKYIEESLKSILDQSYQNLEIIIIDDGSTDRSAEIINSFEDQRVRYLRNETNIRLIRTLNKGIDLAKGKYLARMDADDIAKPERILKQVQLMEYQPKVGVCGSWVNIFGAVKPRTWKYDANNSELYMRMLFKSPFAHPSTMIRCSILRDHNIRYREQFLHAEDYYFWFEMSKYCEFANIQESLLEYRIHENQVGANNRHLQETNTSEIVSKILWDRGIEHSGEHLKLHQKLSGSMRIQSKIEFHRVINWTQQLVVAGSTSKEELSTLKRLTAQLIYYRFEENYIPFNLGPSDLLKFKYWSAYITPGLLKLLIRSLFHNP